MELAPLFCFMQISDFLTDLTGFEFSEVFFFAHQARPPFGCNC